MKRALLLCMLFLAGIAACRNREAATPARTRARARLTTTQPPPVSASAKRYPFQGVITAVAPAKAEITVQHEEIPEYMPAMTMAFSVRDDPNVVALLRPGDRIEATLVVDGEVVFLERLLTKGFVRTPTPGGPRAARPEPVLPDLEKARMA